MIMVDELRDWGKKRGRLAGKTCHMTTDTSLAELHDMAVRMRIKRSWFHKDHYDLNHDMREKAISLGAKPVLWRFMLKNMIKSRSRAHA